ncbi:MFS transporter [Streptomyces sp. NPDC006463]|uniref:MFS transporter n=1 Tax=Streptomyces sp. NPDC006463 TaxID=3364746 RepID=UPI0036A7E009
MNRAQRSILTVTMIATFLAVMDQFIINVALTTIHDDLHASVSQTELAVSGYALVYGAVLITGGRLGDLYGYRRLFAVGVALFTLASLGCGLAPSAGVLVVFRVVQGIGAALFYPQVLSFLQTGFDGAAKGRAFALFGSAVGLASISGQVLGGLLVGLDLFGLSWRPIFLINVPLGLLALAGAAALPGHRGTERPLLDLPGVLQLTAALVLLTLPLVAGPGWGWPWWSYVLLLLAVPTGVVFVLWERRLARTGGLPLLDTQLFRERVFAVGNGLALAFFAGNAGLFFILTLHLQQHLGFSPLRSGLVFAPLAVAFIVASLAAPRIRHRAGLHVLTLAYGVNVLGVLTFLTVLMTNGRAAWDGVPWAPLIALTVIGVGQGLGVSPLMAAVLSDVPRRHAGAASGLMESTAQVGAALGTVVVGLVFQSPLGEGAPASAFAQALTADALLATTALLLMIPLLRPQAHTERQPPSRLPTATPLVSRHD